MKFSLSLHRRLRMIQARRWYLTAGLRSYVVRGDPLRFSVEPAQNLSLEESSSPEGGAMAKSIATMADEVMRHRFSLLGTGPVICSLRVEECNHKNQRQFIGKDYCPIDWHRDFASGFRWNEASKPWHALKVIGSRAGVDIKWPWELSRCQHFPVLALAARLKPDNDQVDERGYEIEFRDEVTDWIFSNPVGVGVNWACDMDVAIRVVNWVAAFLLFGCAIDRRDPWQKRFWKSVHQHGRFLYGMLKYPGGKQGNHYVSELAGLYMLAKLCPFLPGSRKWVALARHGLEEEIVKQVRGDGVHFEESVSYHLLATEIFLYPLLLADTTGDEFSKGYRRLVVKMLGVIDSMRSSRFALPQIGDNDDGYFFKPVPLEESGASNRHLLSFLSSIQHRETILSVSELLPRFFLTDPPSDISIGQVEGKDGVTVFEEAGWAVLRSGPIQVNICVGPVGESGCGHAHEDDLSICIFWDGRPVIVDPGTYCYTPFPEKRNRFRYSPFHNQPQPVRKQEEYLTRPIFARILRPETHWKINEEIFRIETDACHSLSHARRIVQLKTEPRSIQIIEYLNSQERGRVALCFAPGVEVYKQDEAYCIVTSTERVLRLYYKGLAFVLRENLSSSGYGKICKSLWLEAESKTPGMDGWWCLSE